jgi:imidazole glycerol-phosphate synthase subunit HisF
VKRVRVIPVLLLQKGGLVKSVKFSKFKYVGDPINAVKIFNEKEVDEIAVIDISATLEKRGPDFQKIREMASEAFMPMAYGGGISKIEEIIELISAGVEKVILNYSAWKNPELVSEGARIVGSQSIMVSIDARKNLWGNYKVFVKNGKQNTGIDPVTFARQMERAGAGEIIINAIDRDGTFEGYDIELLKSVSSNVHIPVVAVGGAGSVDDMAEAIKHGASAVAAGSLFVFQRPHRAVLISYPGQKELREKIFENIQSP